VLNGNINSLCRD